MSTRIQRASPGVTKGAARTPVQARSRATVQAIIGATARVLASRGYQKTTTNHIAAAAGVSIGSYYQYFADKDAAIAACAAEFAQESLTFSWEHLHDAHHGLSQVRAWLGALFERACQHESLLRVLFDEVPYTWSVPGVRDALVGALEVVEQLDDHVELDDQRRHDRAFVILKAAVAVTMEVAAEPGLRARGPAIIDELAHMIDSYLATGSR